jgi:hypothetical protein
MRLPVVCVGCSSAIYDFADLCLLLLIAAEKMSNEYCPADPTRAAPSCARRLVAQLNSEIENRAALSSILKPSNNFTS